MTPEELAQGQLEAYNARDIDRFLQFYARDVVVYGVPSGEQMRGREMMRERYRNLFENCPELDCKLLNRMVMGDWVVDHEEVTGHAADPDGVVNAVAIYRCRDGLIGEVHFLDS